MQESIHCKIYCYLYNYNVFTTDRTIQRNIFSNIKCVLYIFFEKTCRIFPRGKVKLWVDFSLKNTLKVSFNNKD